MSSLLPIRAVSQEDRTRTSDSEAVGCCLLGHPELHETTRSQALHVDLNSQNHSSACLLDWGKRTEKKKTQHTNKGDMGLCNLWKGRVREWSVN